MGYHVLNHPYWYNIDDSPLTLHFSDYDLDVMNNALKLPGLFPAPSAASFYSGLDRIDQLSGATYKPNNPYCYGKCYMTDSYTTEIQADGLVNGSITYTALKNAMTALSERYGSITIMKIRICPISIQIAKDENTKRIYFLDIMFNVGNFGTDSDYGPYYDVNVYTKMRIYDWELQSQTLTDIGSSTGWRIYETWSHTQQIQPWFGFWYNNDATTPSVKYMIAMVAKQYNNTWDALPFQTGNTITNNGHTFRELPPKPGTVGSVLYTFWESDAYEYRNPTNDVSYDQIEADMGPYGPESEQDGYPTEPTDGHGDDSSDTIAIPDDPLIGVTNVGFVNVYKTGVASLQDIGVELFPDLQYTNPTPISGSTDVVDSIQNGFNAIITALANIPSIVAQQVAATLVNYIIDCHVLPVTPSGGTTENIKVGYKTLTATGDRLTTDYVTFDCGSIKLGEYYGSFADFMTGAKLFLPFVGFVPARPEWFYADTLGVKYKFNVIDGSFVAYVTSTGKYVNNDGSSGTIVAQYSGNACVHLPITGVTYASMVSGLVGAGAGAVASAGSGNIAGVASSVTNAASVSGDIPQSNAYASSGAFLSVRRPYLMIERPVTNYSSSFRKERGLPSNISKKLQNMSGFTILQDVHLDGITATDAEKKELEGLLSKGVIF